MHNFLAYHPKTKYLTVSNMDLLHLRHAVINIVEEGLHPVSSDGAHALVKHTKPETANILLNQYLTFRECVNSVFGDEGMAVERWYKYSEDGKVEDKAEDEAKEKAGGDRDAGGERTAEVAAIDEIIEEIIHSA